jgi:hypothetical protein
MVRAKKKRNKTNTGRRRDQRDAELGLERARPASSTRTFDEECGKKASSLGEQ